MSELSGTNPVAIVTGAGSGIGRATALGLCHMGYAIVLVGRTEKSLDETAGMMSEVDGFCEELLVATADISNPDTAAELIEGTREWAGRLDVLINNAGVAPLTPIAQTGFRMLQETFLINAIGPARLIAEAWQLMAEQPALEGWPSPCVVNVSSAGTSDPFPGFFAYAASKSAVESFTRSIAKEGKSAGIRSFAVAPGAVETKMLRQHFTEEIIPASHTLEPKDVAQVIVECVHGDHDDKNGETIPVSR